ncbi:MAG: hypothetical protein JWO60_1214 [Frankiales bacterium]|nr:hypothetical protein [Frankiales bacterium]
MTIITVSAAYGAGGSVVAPEVARRLGLPFLDRAISAEVARELDVSPEEAATAVVHRTWLERMTFAMSPLADIGGGFLPPELEDEQSLRRVSEQVLREAAKDGAVVLGRAGAWALAGTPGLLRVRLYGPVEAREAQGSWLDGVDEQAARERRASVDRARADYVRRLYGRAVDEPDRFDLQVDSTRLPLEVVADLVVAAAAAVR